MLEHIPDHAAALASFRDRLRPGGHLLLLVPAHPFLYGPMDKAFEHERRYAKRGLGSLLRETGYEAEAERLDDGSYLLTEWNCPQAELARGRNQADRITHAARRPGARTATAPATDR